MKDTLSGGDHILALDYLGWYMAHCYFPNAYFSKGVRVSTLCTSQNISLATTIHDPYSISSIESELYGLSSCLIGFSASILVSSSGLFLIRGVGFHVIHQPKDTPQYWLFLGNIKYGILVLRFVIYGIV